MIKIQNLTKSYKENIIENFSCVIDDTGITVFYGASGIGKTTLLRIISGLEKPDSGQIYGLENKKISYMFQEDRLFSHLTALENVSLVSNENTAKELLKKFGLQNYYNNKIPELSGGMCRRVALARALAFDADVLLLDEPFKGLDNNLKNQIIPVIVDYSKNHSVILVTHDSQEIKVADKIIEIV